MPTTLREAYLDEYPEEHSPILSSSSSSSSSSYSHRGRPEVDYYSPEPQFDSWGSQENTDRRSRIQSDGIDRDDKKGRGPEEAQEWADDEVRGDKASLIASSSWSSMSRKNRKEPDNKPRLWRLRSAPAPLNAPDFGNQETGNDDDNDDEFSDHDVRDDSQRFIPEARERVSPERPAFRSLPTIHEDRALRSNLESPRVAEGQELHPSLSERWAMPESAREEEQEEEQRNRRLPTPPMSIPRRSGSTAVPVSEPVVFAVPMRNEAALATPPRPSSVLPIVSSSYGERNSRPNSSFFAKYSRTTRTMLLTCFGWLFLVAVMLTVAVPIARSREERAAGRGGGDGGRDVAPTTPQMPHAIPTTESSMEPSASPSWVPLEDLSVPTSNPTIATFQPTADFPTATPSSSTSSPTFDLKQVIRTAMMEALPSLMHPYQDDDGPPPFDHAGSPQYCAMNWLTSKNSLPLVDAEAIAERYAMLVLYFSQQDDNGGDKCEIPSDNFLKISPSSDTCLWTASRQSPCDSRHGPANRILRISLSSGKVRGELPLELVLLRHVQSLICNDNDELTGIPPQLWNNWPELIYVDMQGNKQWNGTMPHALFSATDAMVNASSPLQQFVANGNQLGGTFPSTIARMVKLHTLDVKDQEGEGIGGTLPTTISNLVALKNFVISNNNIQGTLPRQVGKLVQLEKLHVSHNKVGGVVPKHVGKMKRLSHFQISNNELSGRIPTQMRRLKKLQIVNMSFNKLTGDIPVELWRPRKLAELDLSLNQLRGSLPPAIGNATNLRILDLSFNKLTGPIPSEVGQLTKLKHLDLSNNVLLDGSLPSEIAALESLASIRLYNTTRNGSLDDLSLLCNTTKSKKLEIFVDCDDFVSVKKECSCCAQCQKDQR